MNLKKSLFVVVALAVFAVAFAGTAPSVAKAQVAQPTIAEIALQNEGFSTLVAALQAADLVDVFLQPGAYTVFAPSNDAFKQAFDALGITAADLLADKELLTSILLYHVAPGRLYAPEVVARGRIMMLDGNYTGVSIRNGQAYINDALISNTDISASNGVIHVIDSVILPPQVVTALFPPVRYTDATIADIAVQNAGFSTLVAALQAADLVDVFAQPGSYTVFAPTNDAFKLAFEALGITAADLLADTDLLTSVLLYHVTAGEVLAVDAVSQGTLTMLDGNTATITTRGGNVYINGALISRADIVTSNGVIHVIDAVILPPAN
jgi:uncharacterized surface protein with fasciclin (FAS1) repeats